MPCSALKLTDFKLRYKMAARNIGRSLHIQLTRKAGRNIITDGAILREVREVRRVGPALTG